MSFYNSWTRVETEILIEGIEKFKKMYPNCVYVKTEFLLQELKSKGFVRKISEIRSKLQTIKRNKEQTLKPWTSDEEESMLLIKTIAPNITWVEVNKLMTIRHPGFHVDEKEMEKKWNHISKREQNTNKDKSQMLRGPELSNEMIIDNLVPNEEQIKENQEEAEKQEEIVEFNNTNNNDEVGEASHQNEVMELKDAALQNQMVIEDGVDEQEEDEQMEYERQDEEESNKYNGKRPKLRKPLSSSEILHVEEMIKECYEVWKIEETNPFYKSHYWKEFPKVAVLKGLNYRQLEFINFTKNDGIEEWKRRYPWDFVQKYQFVPFASRKESIENAVFQLCSMPYVGENGRKKITFFFTQKENKFESIINGLSTLRSAGGCASWMHEFVDLNLKPDFSAVQTICLGKGWTSSFRLKMEAIDITQNYGNYRKSYVNRMDEDSFDYFKNNLIRVGAVVK